MKKHVLITGAASGIGNYIANQYILQSDYIVFCIDINNCTNIKNSLFFNADLRDENVVRDVFSKISRIDLAINCAGIPSTRKKLLEFSQLEIVNCWQDNFLPAFNSVKAEIAIMRQQSKGKIINIASIAGHIGMKNFLAYSTAKAAIINMTKVAAIENNDKNIRVNSISPATIDTPMIRKKYDGKLKN
jgi:NAD(P)-dependent dehydrogenase (short-subunit alcohol dehydrogenase family)